MAQKREYSDFDYENLVHLYYHNPWLRNQVNHEGLEDLWFDYPKKKDKKLLIKLIDSFKYLQQDEAEVELKKYLSKIISSWNLQWNDTLFIGFKKNKFADGSSILLNSFKPVLKSIDSNWIEENLFSYLFDGIDRIKKGGFSDVGIDLKNVVLVDDFIGTGGTAIKIHKIVIDAIEKQKKPIKLYMFSLASMESGKNLIESKGINFESCFILKKGTQLAFTVFKRLRARKKIKKLERILHKGKDKMRLENYTLGYGKSETLYSWNRFNIPNNNYPIFWWSRYRDGSTRKTMFNRMQ